MRNYAAQTFGILALMAMVVSYQQRTRSRLLTFQIAANLLLAANYYLSGAYTGCMMCLVSAARSFVFSRSHADRGKSRLWLYGFLAISLAAGAATWDGFDSMFALAATVLLTVALFSQNPKHMRLLLLPCPALYFVYNYINGSIGGMGSDIFCLASAVVAVWRFDVRDKGKEGNRARGDGRVPRDGASGT